MNTQNPISIKATQAGSDENIRFVTIQMSVICPPGKLGADFRLWAI